MDWVYILKSESDNCYYIGQTGNIEQRLKDHFSGRAKWTRRKGPWKLCYQEFYETRAEAIARERFLKSLKNRKAIEQLIQSGTSSLTTRKR